MKLYAGEITDVRGQQFAVHDGVHAGTVRIIPVGQPESEIVLDVVAAVELRDALGEFLRFTASPPARPAASPAPGGR